MEGLGRVLDIAVALAPYDTNAGAGTGKRVSLRHATGCTIVCIKGQGTANDDPTFTLQQHTASTGGTSSNLAIIDHYYVKYASATTLVGSEAWVKYTQAAAATIADPTGAGTSAESQLIMAVEVDAAKLSDGYGWISMSIADTGSAGAQLAAVLYILHDLEVQRKPANLANTLNG